MAKDLNASEFLIPLRTTIGVVPGVSFKIENVP